MIPSPGTERLYTLVRVAETARDVSAPVVASIPDWSYRSEPTCMAEAPSSGSTAAVSTASGTISPSAAAPSVVPWVAPGRIRSQGCPMLGDPDVLELTR